MFRYYYFHNSNSLPWSKKKCFIQIKKQFTKK